MATAWAEARRAYPIYAALARQFELSATPYTEGEPVPEEIGPAVVERNLRWFDEMDAQVKAYQIRQLPPATLNAKEEGLRAFIQRHLRKAEKNTSDRDKIDFLLVQYFALCAPESFYHDEISAADVSRVLQPVLGDAGAKRRIGAPLSKPPSRWSRIAAACAICWKAESSSKRDW